MKDFATRMLGPGLSLAIAAGAILFAFGTPVPAQVPGPLIIHVQAPAGTISIVEAMERAQARFEGTIIEAALDTGRPHEKTDVVYALRMLTPRGDILGIRVDARDGTILEVDGRGLVDARKAP
jgi:hypothetical protein